MKIRDMLKDIKIVQIIIKHWKLIVAGFLGIVIFLLFREQAGNSIKILKMRRKILDINLDAIKAKKNEIARKLDALVMTSASIQKELSTLAEEEYAKRQTFRQKLLQIEEKQKRLREKYVEQSDKLHGFEKARADLDAAFSELGY